MAYKIGQKVYWKKSKDKAWVTGYSLNKKKREYIISDDWGIEYDKIPSKELKKI